MQIHLDRNERGYPQIAIDAPFEILGQYLDLEMNSPIAVAGLKAEIEAIKSHEQCTVQLGGEEFSLVVQNDEAVIESYDEEESTKTTIKLPDFMQALMAWHEYLFKDISPPIALLIDATVNPDKEAGHKQFTQALDTLSKDASILKDGDDNGYVLAYALEKLAQAGMNEEADQCATLLVDLAARNPGGETGNFLFRLGQRLHDLQKYDLAERLYAGTLKWNPATPTSLTDANRGFLKQVVDCYALLLKQADRGASILPLYDELGEVVSAFSTAYVQLHRAAGLYDELLSVTGLGNLSNSLRRMIRGRQGLETDEEDEAPVKISEDELEAKLRSRVFTNEESTQLYNYIMQLMSRLETQLSYVPQDADPQAFFEPLKKLVDLQLSYMKKIQVDENQEFDMSPPSVSYQHVAADPKAVCKIIESNRGKTEPRPGSPNAEPYVIWKQYKDRKLYRLLPEVARKLSTASNEFVIDFHMNRGIALPKCADNIEKEFESKPHFVAHCFTELAEIYELENRPAEAAIFRERLQKYASINGDEDDRTDLKRKGIAIFVQHDDDEHAMRLYKAMGQELKDQNITYVTIECVGTETHQLAPSKKFMRVYADGPNVNELERIALKMLDQLLPPVDVIIERDGQSRWWQKDA